MKSTIPVCDSALDAVTLRTVQQARESGASNWLSTLPTNKSEFRDAVALRYNKKTHWSSFRLSLWWARWHKSCDELQTRRIRLFKAQFHPRLWGEAPFSSLCGRGMRTTSSASVEWKAVPGVNTSSEARLDIRARGFWRRGQNSFFDVRGTNANSASQIGHSLKATHRKHEQEKKRQYNAVSYTHLTLPTIA